MTGRLLVGVGVLPIVIVILGVVFTYAQPRFFSQANLINVARQGSFLAIAACAQMFPILSGGFDLSVGSIFALVSVIMAQLTLDVGMAWGITVALFAACLVGLFNGLVISTFRVSPFVVTLGTLSAVRGVALILANGQPIFGLPKHFSFLGAGYVGAIPIPIIVGAAVFFVGYILLRWTRFGRYMYAIGGNEEAARVSGIHIKRYTTLAYVVCALLSGIAGAVLSSRVRSGQPTLGEGMELQSIAAVVIGGVALGGGAGTLPGVLYGTIILSVIQNGLNLMNVSTYLQYIVIGMIITLAVVFDRLRHPQRG
ncbi:MAG: ABC transporter permease [Nitrospinota bacterium]